MAKVSIMNFHYHESITNVLLREIRSTPPAMFPVIFSDDISGENDTMNQALNTMNQTELHGILLRPNLREPESKSWHSPPQLDSCFHLHLPSSRRTDGMRAGVTVVTDVESGGWSFGFDYRLERVRRLLQVGLGIHGGYEVVINRGGEGGGRPVMVVAAMEVLTGWWWRGGVSVSGLRVAG